MIGLVAPSHRAAKHWAYHHKVPNNKWLYIDEVSKIHLLGSDATFIFINEWWDLPQSDAIESIIRQRYERENDD